MENMECETVGGQLEQALSDPQPQLQDAGNGESGPQLALAQFIEEFGDGLLEQVPCPCRPSLRRPR